jgi:dUTP pyrophosphatase
MEKANVYIKTSGDGRIPVYASPHAAGCDLYASKEAVIRPGETIIMPLNFVMALSEGMEAQIRPRSGLALRTSLRLPNSPGTIDADYRNDVGVIMYNSFNPSLLPQMIMYDSDLLEQLDKYYRPVALEDYLAEKQPLRKTGGHANETLWQSLMNTVIFIDENDNPYGTLYIQKGDRIAQMIISRHVQANFIEHDNPESIGINRGGGFGSTGTSAIDESVKQER